MNLNPVMDGNLLDIWFFASLRIGGVKFSDENGFKQKWDESYVYIMDLTSLV
jgi:hypothetical protein